MLARKILGIDIRKTELHTVIRKIEVDENGQLGFDFYLASDVLASTPTAVPPLWGYHTAIAKHGSTSPHLEGCSLDGGLQLGNTLLLESKTKAAQPIQAGSRLQAGVGGFVLPALQA